MTISISVSISISISVTISVSISNTIGAHQLVEAPLAVLV